MSPVLVAANLVSLEHLVFIWIMGNKTVLIAYFSVLNMGFSEPGRPFIEPFLNIPNMKCPHPKKAAGTAVSFFMLMLFPYK